MKALVVVDRELHPATWWLWAGAMAVALTRTTNIIYALIIAAIAGVLVQQFRRDQPWAHAFRWAMTIAVIVLSLRLIIGIIFGVPGAGSALFSLPRVQLPSWLAGITLGGPVTRERLGSVLSEGLVIVGLIALMGAATALTNPRRILRVLPAAVHEVGVAIVVATTFTPQLLLSIRRIQEARRLRGHRITGVHAFRGLGRPVLEEALDRAIALSGAMESRGYGRAAAAAPLSGPLLAIALVALGAGTYGVLTQDAGTLWVIAMISGFAIAIFAVLRAGMESERTTYRPEPWSGPEWAIVLPAIGTAAIFSSINSATLTPNYSSGLIPSTHLFVGLILTMPLFTLAIVRPQR